MSCYCCISLWISYIVFTLRGIELLIVTYQVNDSKIFNKNTSILWYAGQLWLPVKGKNWSLDMQGLLMNITKYCWCGYWNTFLANEKWFILGHQKGKNEAIFLWTHTSSLNPCVQIINNSTMMLYLLFLISLNLL